VTAASGSSSINPATGTVLVIGPNIAVTKSVSPQEVLAAEVVTYTVTLENTGNDAGVVDLISDTLPLGFEFKGMLPGGTITDPPIGTAGTIAWEGPFAMPIGAQKTLIYQARTSMASGLESPINKVVAVYGGKHSAPGAAAVTVKPHLIYLPLTLKTYTAPYFVTTKTVAPLAVYENEEVVYTVQFTNPGDDPALLDTIFDNLPPEFTFMNMESGSDITASPVVQPDNTLRWGGPFSPTGPGGTLTLKYRVHVGTETGTYENRVTATTLIGKAPVEPGRATVVVREPILLWEDFESGTDGWEPFLNYWRLEPEQWYLRSGGGYAGSKGMRHTYWLGATDPERGAHDALYMYQGPGSDQWTNYRLEVRSRSDAKGILGLWVRGKYIPNQPSGRYVEGYYVTWQPGRNRGVDLSRLSNTGDSAGAFYDPVYLTSGGFEMEDNQWYLLAVEVRGSNIKVFVDGINVIDFNDATYSRGTIGFYGYKMENAGFDNVLVTPLD